MTGTVIPVEELILWATYKCDLGGMSIALIWNGEQFYHEGYGDHYNHITNVERTATPLKLLED